MTAVLEALDLSAQYMVAEQPAFVRQFGLLATAPAGVRRLRDFILSLAVQGKLVTQDASDAPASCLLALIEARRRKLVAEGKVKGDKPELGPADLDSPFAAPPGWEWISAAAACVVITDGDHQAPPKAASGVPFLVISDVRDGIVDLGSATRFVSHDYYSALDWAKKPRQGDILYTTVGSLGIPVPVLHQQAFCFQRHIALLRPALPELQPFLALALRSSLAFEQAEGGATGIAQKTVPLSVLRRLRLPLPPLNEQARIVARVDELMRLCDALETKGQLEAEQHARLLDVLLGALTASTTPEELADNWQRVAAHFDLLLDRPEAIHALERALLDLAVCGLLTKAASATASGCANQWRRMLLGDAVDFLNGYAFKSEWFRQSGVRLVRNVNVGHGSLDWSQPAYVDEKTAGTFSQFTLSDGDVVLSLDRPLISTGLKVAVVRSGDLPCLLLQRVARLTPKPRILIRDYLLLWLRSSAFTQVIDPGRSNGVPHISTKQVAALQIDVPPVDEQLRIVAWVAELRRMCADLRQRLVGASAVQSRLADALVELALA